jgi:hypothetical protein
MSHASRRLLTTLPVLFGGLLLGGLVACNTDQTAPPPPPSGDDVATPPTWTCNDGDGDSYGVGCRMGADCDDSNPDVTVECLCDGQKSPGCSCDEAGAQAACGTVYSRVGDTVVCGQGVTSCDGDEWGECIINNAVTLDAPTDKAQSGLRPLALGSAGACATNPCDPACKSFTDTPDNSLPLTSSTGVVATTSGVTLQSGEAIVVPPVVGTGYACNNAAYPTGGGCAHHICKTGSALAKYCDGDAQSLTGTTLFSEPFTDNSKGWTLGANWDIASATASTGHGAGNADPSTDTTSGSNGVAGTVIGGNLGGTSTTFLTEGFTNLSAWTQTGDGRWSAATRTSSTGYTTTSGNPVAHADRCNVAGCTITSGALNLSTYPSASLSFQYFMSINLEAGEYLRLDGSNNNGVTWTQLFIRNTEAEQDSIWHAASVALPSTYMVNNARFRFVTTSSQTDEATEVDDIRIIVPPASVTSYLTSPVINTAASAGSASVSFRRWLNVNADFVAKLEVYNGSSWTALYTSSGAVSDSSWQTSSYDITAYKSASTQFRFSYAGASTTAVSGWNIDDFSVTGQEYTGGTSLCVNKVCAQRPECCTTSWSLECVELLSSACKVECAEDTKNGNSCIACFNDTTLTVDVDGDGQSPATGDCRECDSGISAGAYDLPGNNIDENCDGTPDNEVTTCDASLSASGDAATHAKSLGICKTASGNSWGVVSAAFVRADGVTACDKPLQYQIRTTFGSGNKPTAGSSMSVFSSGTARVPGETGYVAPNGTGYPAGTSSTPKYSVPAAAGCSSGTAGYDSCGLKLVLKAPTNANSFGYNFDFFTSEYPEWLCTQYNDAYVAYYEGSKNTASNKNISFDSANNPVSVNNGLFSIPGWPPPALGTNTYLNGTGYDGVCSNSHSGASYVLNSICGGSTGWLQTKAPVKPGETITLIFNVWDTGDRQWDSTVLLDNFTWSTSSASVGTSYYVPSTPPSVIPATFSEGWFVRDYDMSGGCDEGLVPVWSLWSWSAATPGDSKVEFYVQTATSAAGLATATRDPLLFTNPPGPTALAGTAAIAKAGSPDTRTGSATVQNTLAANSRNLNSSHLRISAKLVPTTDKLQAPTLTSWNLQTSCQESQ